MRLVKLKYHTILAEYFASKDYFLESLEDQRKRAKQLPPSPRPVNTRKVVELPWQRMQSQNWDEVETLFTDLHFLESKTESGKVFDLAKDFSFATNNIPYERPKHRILSLIEEALHRDIYLITCHPTTFFQCIWNQGWWYDCPIADSHYITTEPEDDLSIESQFRERLYTLIEYWRKIKEANTPDFIWLRSLRPPFQPLGSTIRRVINGHNGGVTSVALFPDNKRVVSGSFDQTIRIWDVDSGQESYCLNGHEGFVQSVAVMNNPERIISGGDDKFVHIWDCSSGKELYKLIGHKSIVTCVAAGPCEQIASGSGDKTARVWDVRIGQELYCLAHAGWVWSVAFSPDGQLLASGSDDKTVRIWDTCTGKQICALNEHEATVTSVVFSPNGQLLASSSSKNVYIWNINSRRKLSSFCGHTSSISSLSFTNDGMRLISGSHDKTIRVWDVNSGTELNCLRGHEHTVQSVAYFSDGCRALSGSFDRTIRVWDTTQKLQIRQICGDEGWLRAIKFSPEGRWVATGGDDGNIRIWDTANGVLLRSLRGHELPVSKLEFMPGTSQLSSHAGNEMRLWNIETGESLNTIHLKEGSNKISQSEISEITAEELDTVIQFKVSEKIIPILWYPRINRKVTNPTETTWAGAIGNHLHIFTLEGTIENVEWLQQQSLSYNKVGEIQETLGYLDNALNSYESSLKIMNRLIQSDPENIEWQHALSVFHNNIGDIQRKQGNFTEAFKTYETTITLRKHIATIEPQNIHFLRDLCIAYYDTGLLTYKMKEYKIGLSYAELAFNEAEKIYNKFPENQEFNQLLQGTQKLLMSFIENI